MADDVVRAEDEVQMLKGELERVKGRAGALEERLKREAVEGVRRRVLSEVAAARRVNVDAGRIGALLARLTGDVKAAVDEDGSVVVSDEEERKIRENAEALFDGVVVSGVVQAPPIVPGEPPQRVGGRRVREFVNCWGVERTRRGAARGREMIAEAAAELEREGRI